MNDICWIFTETILGNYAYDNTLTARVWMKTYISLRLKVELLWSGLKVNA